MEKKKQDAMKYRLADAMKVCMKTMPVEKITVGEIVAEGKTTRQTFYRNFQDKYDLINWYFDRILNESFKQMGKGTTIRESLVLKFRYIQQEQLFFRAAFSYDDQNNLTDHDFEMIFDFYKNLIHEKSGAYPKQEIQDMLEMYCHSSVYMTVKWIMKENARSAEDLADLMVEAMPYPLSQLFKKLNILD